MYNVEQDQTLPLFPAPLSRAVARYYQQYIKQGEFAVFVNSPSTHKENYVSLIVDEWVDPCGPLLLSRKNPTGLSVEFLVEQIQIDLLEKEKLLEKDLSIGAEIVRKNNKRMVSLLQEVALLNKDTREALNLISKDTGQPRIGKLP